MKNSGRETTRISFSWQNMGSYNKLCRGWDGLFIGLKEDVGQIAKKKRKDGFAHG